MEATLLLCDHAEAIGGKLYINGGGWNVLLRPGAPVNLSLAILIEVPWDEANTQHRLRAYLLTEDGEPVAAAPVFLQTFGHGLWAAGRGPQVWPDSELQRTGRIARLDPGGEVPLTVSWHAADGEPALVSYGDGLLQLPG